MAYLIAKYCLVFFVTGLLGFLIGRWSMRRLFVDVTDSFETLSEASRAGSQAPWEEIRNRFDGISGNVRNIVRNEFRAHPYPEIPRALFSKLENGLGEIRQSIAELPAPEQVDFSVVTRELQQLNRAVNNLSQNVSDNVATHDDIDSLGQTLEKQLERLAGDVATIPELVEAPIIDLTPLERKIASLQATVETLPQPAAVDLVPLESRLGDIQQRVGRLPDELAAEPTDLTPLAVELANLRHQIELLAANSEAPDPNVSVISEKITGLEKIVLDTAQHLPSVQQQLAEVDERISSLAEREDTRPLRDVHKALGNIESGLKEVAALNEASRNASNVVDQRLNKFDRNIDALLKRPSSTEKHLSALNHNVDSLRDELRSAGDQRREFEQSTFSKRFDELQNTLEIQHGRQLEQLAPIDERLNKIHNKLSALNALAPDVILENGSQPSIGPKLLKRPEFGKKDNLQQIAGIGPKLEQSLNRLGVYYYWQIAAWNKRDIRTVDANLEAFRGRIERDDWVRQAKLLRKLSHASRPPSGPEMAQKLN